jgi:hypothetical protein
MNMKTERRVTNTITFLADDGRHFENKGKDFVCRAII